MRGEQKRATQRRINWKANSIKMGKWGDQREESERWAEEGKPGHDEFCWMRTMTCNSWPLPDSSTCRPLPRLWCRPMTHLEVSTTDKNLWLAVLDSASLAALRLPVYCESPECGSDSDRHSLYLAREVTVTHDYRNPRPPSRLLWVTYAVFAIQSRNVEAVSSFDYFSSNFTFYSRHFTYLYRLAGYVVFFFLSSFAMLSLGRVWISPF